MEDNPVVVLVAVPSQEDGARIARILIEKRLAACVQALPITSTYRWEEKIETAGEVLLLAKTRAGIFPALQAAIVELHPYDVPEIVSLPTDAVHGPYREWLMAETAEPSSLSSG